MGRHRLHVCYVRLHLPGTPELYLGGIFGNRSIIQNGNYKGLLDRSRLFRETSSAFSNPGLR